MDPTKMRAYVFVLWLFLGLGATIARDANESRRYESEADADASRSTNDAPEDPQGSEIVYDENGKPRDKRNLGILISSIANAFGYTITPVRVLTIPNSQAAGAAPPAQAPAPNPKAPRGAPPKPPAPSPPRGPAAPPSKGPAPPAPPQRQRETIRITGLLNFGQNADANIPGQLRQYEQVIHGNAYSPPLLGQAAPSSAPAAPAAPPAAPPAPKPLTTLAEIPQPISPNILPLLPPTLPPKRPSSAKPSKQEVETEYRNQENVENYNVQSKELADERELYAGLARPEQVTVVHTVAPNWHERLKELEERQREYAEKLKQHEEQLARQQQDHENTDERFRNREKEITERDRNRSGEVQQLGEREYARVNQNENASLESDEENEKSTVTYPPVSKDYEEQEKRRAGDDQESGKYGNYDNNDYEEELPVSKTQQMPNSEIQNSYGESLEDEGKPNARIADYFVRFKDPMTGLYDPEKTQDSENYYKDKEPWWKSNQDNRDEHVDHLREKYFSPGAEFKYEEYELPNESAEHDSSAEKRENLEEPVPTEQSQGQNSPEYAGALRDGYAPYGRDEERGNEERVQATRLTVDKNVGLDSGENLNEEPASDREESNEEKSSQKGDVPRYRFDFSTFAPYYSPIQYAYDASPEDATTPRSDSYYQQENPEAVEKEDSSEGTEENTEQSLQPKIGLPERLGMKSLHEGESKELRAWPAPFDHVFDSTEQTNVAELPRLEVEPESPTTPGRQEEYQNEIPSATPVERIRSDYDAFFDRYSRPTQGEQEPEQYQRYYSHQPNSRSRSEGDSRSEELYATLPSTDTTSQQEHHPEKYAHVATRNNENGHEQNSRQNDERNPTNRGRYDDHPSRTTHQGQLNVQDDRNRYDLQPRYVEAVDGRGYQDAGERRIEIEPSKDNLRDRGANFGYHYTPAQPNLNGRRFDGDGDDHVQGKAGDHDNIESRPRDDNVQQKFEDPKSAHDFFGFSHNDYDYENGKLRGPKASSNDGADEFVVTEPPPYHHNEKLTEFTDEPETDTEKVKVKEYRNKIATVTVSKIKQLSNEEPIKLIGYSHHY